GLESLEELFTFAGSLLLGIFLAHNFRSLFAAVDLNRLALGSAEFNPLHVGKLDIVGKHILAAEFAASETEEPAGGVDVFHVGECLAAKSFEHLIDGLIGARLRMGCHHKDTKTQRKEQDRVQP